MFFSKVVLTVSLGAILVLASPHAVHDHTLHRRAVAARVALTSNFSDVTVKQEDDLDFFSAPIDTNTPDPNLPPFPTVTRTPQIRPATTGSAVTDPNTTDPNLPLPTRFTPTPQLPPATTDSVVIDPKTQDPNLPVPSPSTTTQIGPPATDSVVTTIGPNAHGPNLPLPSLSTPTIQIRPPTTDSVVTTIDPNTHYPNFPFPSPSTPTTQIRPATTDSVVTTKIDPNTTLSLPSTFTPTRQLPPEATFHTHSAVATIVPNTPNPNPPVPSPSTPTPQLPPSSTSHTHSAVATIVPNTPVPNPPVPPPQPPQPPPPPYNPCSGPENPPIDPDTPNPPPTHPPTSTRRHLPPTTTFTATQPSDSTDPFDPNNQFGFGPHIGDITWFKTGLGSCGIFNKDSDFIIAVSKEFYDGQPGYDKNGNPNLNPLCGKKVEIVGSDGKKATAQITDRCEGCNITSIDLTRDLFKQLGDLSAGRIHGVTWKIEPTRFPVT